MKTRLGFVSNSSSSSFIIGSNFKLCNSELTKTLYNHVFGKTRLSRGSMKFLFSAFADHMVSNARQLDENYTNDNFMPEDKKKLVSDIVQKYKHVYVLTAGTEDSYDPISYALHLNQDEDVVVDTDDFAMIRLSNG